MNASAQAEGLRMVSSALGEAGGHDAAALGVAQQYVSAFGNIAKDTNTIIVPSDVTDASSMVAQALTVYKQLSKKKDFET